MNILGPALIGATLLAAAIQNATLVDPGTSSPRPADAAETSLITAQSPGECCNDDFRQALPLWEEPVDSPIAKP